MSSRSADGSPGIRGGLRDLDDHASWREVYDACHVGVGVDE